VSGAGPEASFARESWTGERRVTCDLDDARPCDIYRAVYGLRSAGAYDVEVRVSSSGNGAHVRGWFDADDVDADDVETLRLAHGDHPRRAWMDRTHNVKPHQILFSRKHGGEAGPWRTDPHLAVDELVRRADHLDGDTYETRRQR